MFPFASGPRSLAAALRDLHDPKLSVRLSAMRDLVRHARAGEAQAVEALSQVLEDPEEAIRAEAALALADADARSAIELLARVARQDVSVRARQMALLALGELGAVDSAAALAVLGAARRSAEPAERFQALLALHQLRAPGADEAILEGMVDVDPEVRRLAFRVARAHFDPEGGVPPQARSLAATALNDDDLAVRVAAALALAEFGDASGKAILLDLVRGRVPRASAEDEQAAIELVADLEIDEARAPLARRAFARLFRDPFAYEARIALARMGDPRAKAAILRSLGALRFEARTLAVVAVGRARLQEARPRLLEWLDRPERADPNAVRDALAALDR